MSHVHYEEEQRFSNIRWIWIAVLILLIVPIGLITADKNASQKDITVVMLSTVFAFLPMVGILFYSKLMVKINEEGIHYKFFPAVIKWRVIPKSIVESFEVTPKRNFLEKIECGYRRNHLNKTITMNITGGKFARILLKDGRKLKIGTDNPEGFERAMRKLTSTDNQ